MKMGENPTLICNSNVKRCKQYKNNLQNYPKQIDNAYQSYTSIECLTAHIHTHSYIYTHTAAVDIHNKKKQSITGRMRNVELSRSNNCSMNSSRSSKVPVTSTCVSTHGYKYIETNVG